MFRFIFDRIFSDNINSNITFLIYMIDFQIAKSKVVKTID